ncbi:hypothetical protein B0H67DRAFT_548333 [Lasiosphaeris hirsuta]|uniref:Uncharacterized protein n=1 Tax=Lasiosphaeris hirsuta TaxID=260670 RepID=A0AA40B9T5_9PEZI|nr:hypothetical protein B0H67DRAFT_548333 [Lasiosphaeris hirsuta]
MDSIAALLVSRQFRECLRTDDGFIDEDSCYVPFWYTRTGVILKWSLFLGLTALIGLYILLGYLHAKRRIAKGLAPLGYHRWLISRSQLARVDPRYQYPAANAMPYNPNNQYYNMHAMPPPPVYDPNRPPMYPGPPGPPDGATKVDPSQQDTGVEPARRFDEYQAPPGPPPANTYRL